MERAGVDQRAGVDVNRHAAEEVQFVEADTGRRLHIAPRKLLENASAAHCDRGVDSAVAAEDEWLSVAKVE